MAPKHNYNNKVFQRPILKLWAPTKPQFKFVPGFKFLEAPKGQARAGRTLTSESSWSSQAGSPDS